MPPISQIKIYGKIYSVKYAASPKDLQELATYVDSKMKELSRSASAKTSTVDLAVLVALNIAGELLELKKQIKTNQELFDEKAGRLIKQLAETLRGQKARAGESDNS